MKPITPLHRWPEGKYKEMNAASHSTSDAFAARQRKRIADAQREAPAIVRQIGRKVKP